MNKRPLLLDLFCCEGGAAVGYHRVGFDVVGVDIEPQPRYPFASAQADAIQVLKNYLAGYDLYAAHHYYQLREFSAIHASPPCQAYSRARHTPGAAGRSYPDLLPETRRLLRLTGLPWVIENVELAPMKGVVICGTALGLRVRRHRVFESSVMLFDAGPCRHLPGNPSLGHNARTRSGPRGAAYVARSGRTHYRPLRVSTGKGREAMGCEWMSRRGLSEAIPPAYTEFIGRQLLNAIRQEAPQ